jgi:hypothetical protein
MVDSSAEIKSHDFSIIGVEGEALGTLRIKSSHLWWRSAKAPKWKRIEFGKVIRLVEHDGHEVDVKTNHLATESA